MAFQGSSRCLKPTALRFEVVQVWAASVVKFPQVQVYVIIAINTKQ